ncbi:MAG: hypothetical protein ABI643_03050 [Candidatus Doudnabacteria bacterium]
MALVVKQSGEKHFTRDFGGGTISDRVIVSALDGCPCEVRIFKPKAGFCPGENVIHTRNELVVVLSGKIQVSRGDMTHVLGSGGKYFVDAGTPTTFIALEDSELLLDFHGSLPEGE